MRLRMTLFAVLVFVGLASLALLDSRHSHRDSAKLRSDLDRGDQSKGVPREELKRTPAQLNAHSMITDHDRELYSIVFQVIRGEDGEAKEIAPFRIFDPLRTETTNILSRPSLTITLPESFLLSAKEVISKIPPPYNRAPLHPDGVDWVYLFYDPARPRKADLGLTPPFAVDPEVVARIQAFRPKPSHLQNAQKQAVLAYTSYLAVEDGRRMVEQLRYEENAIAHNRARTEFYYSMAQSMRLDESVQRTIRQCGALPFQPSGILMASAWSNVDLRHCRESISKLKSLVSSIQSSLQQRLPEDSESILLKAQRANRNERGAAAKLATLQKFEPTSMELQKEFREMCMEIPLERRPAQLSDCHTLPYSAEVASTIHRLTNED